MEYTVRGHRPSMALFSHYRYLTALTPVVSMLMPVLPAASLQGQQQLLSLTHMASVPSPIMVPDSEYRQDLEHRKLHTQLGASCHDIACKHCTLCAAALYLLVV
jgi:hypothetical protein